MPCITNYKDKNGQSSLLYPELEKVYGPSEAARKFRQVEEALDSGALADYPLRANGEPTLDLVKALVASGVLAQPTQAMVNGAALDRIEEVVSKSIDLVTKRVERYQDTKASGTALEVSDKTRKDASVLLGRLKSLEAKAAYVELIKFADKQLREFNDFVTVRFNAAKAAASDGKDMQAAALDEIRVQLGAYVDVFAPDLAVDDSVLKDMLVGRDGSMGLLRQKEELEKAVDAAQLDLLVALTEKEANRQGLSEKEIRDHIKGGLDVSWATKALGGASQSSSKLLALINTVVDMAKLRGRDAGIQLKEDIFAKDAALKAAGIKDFGFMLETENGIATGQYLQKISKGYYDTKRSLREAVEAAGEYIKGSGLSDEQKAHNKKVYAAKTSQRLFNQAETIADDGTPLDGDNHRYTAKFKAEREVYEELRQDGKYWSWKRKNSLFGKKDKEAADEAYARYVAKYYGEPRMVSVMISKYVKGVRVPTGEIREQEMRFTNEKATTEIVEENHRDSRYQDLLSDRTPAGVAKLDYYNFFTENLDKFVRTLPKEDVDHIRKGELPAVMASVASRYNSKAPGYLDYLGRAVSSPLATLKSWSKAAELGRQGVQVGEDGTVLRDVDKKYTGRFKSPAKISRLTTRLEGLDTSAANFESERLRLTQALEIEQNRPEGGQVETDLSKLLYAFGGSALNYSELKQQEGTLNLIRDAIRNRTYYEEQEGKVLLNEEGQPIPKKNYAPQLQKQAEDWLSQNYYGDTDLGKDSLEVWGRRFKQYVSVTFQGLNYAAALKNLTAGNLSSRIYASGGELGFDKSTMNWAFKEVMSESTKIIADRIADRLSGKKGFTLHSSTSKVDALLERYGLMEHSSDLNGGGKFNSLAFAGTTIGEYHIQSQLAIAKLKTTKLIGLDGNESNAYDAQTLVKGHLVVDPNYKTAWEKVQHRATLDIRNVIKHTQGNHSDQDKVALEKDWLGASVLQFKRWAYAAFKNRLGRAQFDEGIGITTEGYYRGIGKLATAIKNLGLKAEAWHSLSTHEKALVKQTLQELKYIVGTLAFMLIAEGLKPDPDDDDTRLLYLGTNLAERVVQGTQGELSVVLSPIELYNLTQNPAAGLGILRDFAVFVKNVAEVPYYGLSGNEDKLDYQTGVHKGESKVLKSAMDLVPILRMKRISDQLATTGSVWIK